jgi:UDP-N-acetylmuramoyl-tripeptide--D-alanyl-D-alanine ligase
LNGDDAFVMAQGFLPLGKGEAGGGQRITYGFADGLDVRAENYRLETREGDPNKSFDLGEEFCAIHFDLVMDEERVPVVLHGLLGRGMVYAALAAVAIGKHFGMTIDEIVAGLANFKPQAGRMRPIAGIKGTLLLDDTYNAAPASMAAALDVLRGFSPAEGARRIAVLGKMAELGRYSEDEHRLLGLRAAEVADLLVCVGEEARDIRRGALEAGMDEVNIQSFKDSVEAGRWLDFNVKKGDVILIKGSQSARMEKTVKDLMAEPLRAPEFLVRQYGKWLET